MKRIMSFILVITTILCLSSCCEQPSNSYEPPKNFIEDFTKALEESNKVIDSTISEMGRFKLYDILPDGTKIYQSVNLYVIVSPTGGVAIDHR